MLFDYQLGLCVFTQTCLCVCVCAAHQKMVTHRINPQVHVHGWMDGLACMHVFGMERLDVLSSTYSTCFWLLQHILCNEISSR